MARGQVNIGRFMWWPPWGVTRPWLPRVSSRGGDEWCNDSVTLILPFLGAFIFFWRPGPMRTMPCAECWDVMQDHQRNNYLPGGYLEGGRVHQDRADALFTEPA
jgi:hypothetical protein